MTYNIKAYDPDTGDPIPATCSGGSASGGGSGDFSVTSVFPVGTTTVHCDATLSNGDPVSNDFSVTVTDTTPPVVGTVSLSPRPLVTHWKNNHLCDADRNRSRRWQCRGELQPRVRN